MRLALACTATTLLLGMVAAQAQDASRPFNPIARPAARPPLPGGAVRVTPPRPVSRDRVESAIATVMKAWNDRRLDTVLSPRYQRRDELRDALETKVPRDAKLRIVAIQGWQILDQYRVGGRIYTELSVTVRTQQENNDPVNGYVVRDGTNEYVITLNEVAP
jgi:hypothetical protein